MSRQTIAVGQPIRRQLPFMTYTNFNLQVSGKHYLPEDRVRLLKKLQQDLKESRASYKKNKSKRKKVVKRTTN